MTTPVPTIDEWLRDEGPFWIGHYSTLVKRFIGVDDVYPTRNKIDFVGKTENLREDLLKALTEAGEDFQVPKYHSLFEDEEKRKKIERWSNIQDYTRGISDATKELIYRGEKWVFDTFEYEE
jgi:hypothetical protein